jgi:hypothetical protein
VNVKSFVQPVTDLVVAHFEAKALNENLEANAKVIDPALSLQEAAVAAIGFQMKASLASSLAARETTDVLDPYQGTDPANPWRPDKWASNRDAYVRATVTLDSVGSAKKAITQLRQGFRDLVANEGTSINFQTLLDDINKMAGYVSALQSSASAAKSKNQKIKCQQRDKDKIAVKSMQGLSGGTKTWQTHLISIRTHFQR